MGAWGYKPFENDSAIDARGPVRKGIERRLWTSLRKHPDDDATALAYVAMLVLLKMAPSSRSFWLKVRERFIANFNAKVPLHRRTAAGSEWYLGRRGNTWKEPNKRLSAIRRTLTRWRSQ